MNGLLTVFTLLALGSPALTCDEGDLPNCLFNLLNEQISLNPEFAPLPNFHSRQGREHLHVRDITVRNLFRPDVEVPTIETINSTHMTLTLGFTWSQIELDMMAGKMRTLPYTDLAYYGNIKGDLRGATLEIELLMLIPTSLSEMPTIFDGRVAMEDFVDKHLTMENLQAEWWVYAIVGDPVEDILEAVKNDWWSLMSSELHDWIETVFERFVAEP